MSKSPLAGGEGRYTTPHCEPLESTVTENPVTTAPLPARLPEKKRRNLHFKYVTFNIYVPFEEEGVYCLAHVGRSVSRSVHPSVEKFCPINNYRTHGPKIF